MGKSFNKTIQNISTPSARNEITKGKNVLLNITLNNIPLKIKIIPINNNKIFLFFCLYFIII